MPAIIHFAPKSELSARENLHEFTRMCREDLTVFGENLDWQATGWPGAANFTKLGAHSRGYAESDRMDGEFIDFAKAYFRYQQGHHPTKARNELMALRAIEAALLTMTGKGDAINIDVATLDEASQLARVHYSSMAAYHCGREIQRLASFLSVKQLIPADLSTWKSPIRKPGDETIRTGTKARAIQEKKLPGKEALDALAEIFASDPKDPRDIFTSCTFAMTMCAPARISEILDLPADCEVEIPGSDGIMRYGWRFYSAKGFEGDIKWIPEVMVPIAKEAVRRLRALTEEPRRLARWVEDNPRQFFRHANCPDVDEYQALRKEQAAQALGLAGLSNTGLSNAHGAYSLSSLWQHTMRLQPKSFPWLNAEKRIKYSNALFCMFKNMLGSQKGTLPVVLWAPTNNIFNNDLGPRNVSMHLSIFDRHGYKSTHGEPIKLTSHQARHLITTLAHRGGLTQEQIAKWAGRADPKQNRVYNHMSEWEMVAKAEAMDTSLTLFGPAGEVAQHVPVTNQQLDLMERGPMHVSLWGVCVHDYVMAPCEKFRDCLNCEEHVCIKDTNSPVCAERLARVKARLSETEVDFAAAKDAIAKGYAGADRWHEYLEKTVVRLRQLVGILESPLIQNGAQIKLRDGRDFSHLRRVIRLKVVEALEHKTPDAGLLSGMTKLLGDGVG